MVTNIHGVSIFEKGRQKPHPGSATRAAKFAKKAEAASKSAAASKAVPQGLRTFFDSDRSALN